VAKLTASDGAAEDYFGAGVSISGNYAIVGAPLDDDKGSYSGAVYIFEQNAGTWAEVAKLTASDGDADDRFGLGVSISGKYAIVGSILDDDNGIDSGSAYVFERNAGTWTEVAKLTAIDGIDGDHFGYGVSISGNYAMIGACYDDDNGSNSGSVYVYNVIDTCEGDFEPDGDVDSLDLLVFAQDFGRTGCDSGPPCEGDFDSDTNVDIFDLATFATDFGKTCCP